MSEQPFRSPRTDSQIEADLGAARDRLTGSLAVLIDEVHPIRIKQRLVARVKGAVQARVEDARALVFNARGDLRRDRVLTLGGTAAGALTFFLVLRRVVSRRRSS